MAGHQRSPNRTLGTTKFVTKSALAAVLQDIAEHGLPDAISRQSIKRRRDADLNAKTPFGQMIVSYPVDLAEKGKHVLKFIHPAALLSHLCATCLPFATHLAKCMRSNPPPWKVILYSDEVTPGNVLRHDNTRKLQALYWTFKELGPAANAAEHYWFNLGVCRSDVVKKLRGRMSFFVKTALQTFQEPVKLIAGWQLRLCSEDASVHRAMLTGAVDMILADEAALKDMLDFKGASGTVPCPLCANVVLASSGLPAHGAAEILAHNNLQPHLWTRQTDESVGKLMRHLATQSAALPKTKFKKLQQSCGFNWNEHGLLCATSLDDLVQPISALTFDWMHCYLVGGIWNIETAYIIGALKEVGIPQSSLHSFLQDFQWPAQVQSRAVAGHGVFSKPLDGNDVKCTASQGLSLYGVIRVFLVHHAAAGRLGPVKDRVEAYLALCAVLDLLQAARTRSVTPKKLQDALLHHQRLSQAAFGIDHWIPKYHYAAHLPDMYQRRFFLVPCFVHERKHRELKRYANALSNTAANFEETLLRDILLVQLEELQTMPLECTPRLLHGKPPSFAVRRLIQQALGLEAGLEVHVASSAVFAEGQKCSANDVVAFQDDEECKHVGRVDFHTQVAGQLWSAIAVWTPSSNNEFRVSTETQLIPTRSILYTCAYRVQGDSAVVASCK